MDLLSLPDEMLASILKYRNFDEILGYRLISSRIDRVAKTFGLNRVECDDISIRLSTMFKTEKEVHQMREDLNNQILRRRRCSKNFPQFSQIESDIMRLESEAKEYILKPKDDDIDYNVCMINVWLKGAGMFSKKTKHSDKYMRYRRCIFERYTDVEKRYEALDRIFKKVIFTGKLSLSFGVYDDAFDECLFRNRKTFRSIKFVKLSYLKSMTGKVEFLRGRKGTKYNCSL